MSKKKKQKITHHQPLTINHKIVNICDKIIEWGIYAIAFFVPISEFRLFNNGESLSTNTTMVQVITLTLLVFFLIKMVNTERIKIIKTGLELPILFFVLIIFCSTFFSINFFNSLEGLFSGHEGLYIFLTYVLIFFLISNNIKKIQIDNILFIMLITGSLISIYGVVQYVNAQNPQRITSTFSDPNLFGGFLIMIILIELSSLLFKKLGYKELIFIISLIGICLLALFLTYSRAAFLSLILTGIFLITYRFKEVFNKKMLIVIIVVTGIAPLIFYLTSKNVFKKILLLRKESVITRVEIWKSTLHIIRDHPYIGSGLDTFGLIFPKYKSFTYVSSQGGGTECYL